MGQTLAELLDHAARGRFPVPDGGVTLLPQPSERDAGVVALTGHSAVFVDEDPEWIAETLASLECDPLAATLNPRFLAALMDRTDRVADTIDVLMVADPLPARGTAPVALREAGGADHSRAARALRYREDVRVWTTDGGVLILGRGVAGRWEAAIEVDEAVRHRGLGRLLATAARQLVPDERPVWAQIAPGNARSIRTFQAAGYRAIGAEVLLLPREGA
jgi:GNAT superfamily N-acetyltransferase